MVQLVNRLVHKQLAGPVAAGLAVVADDTGRVLMIQRPLKNGDPNGGKWEFPGGRIEEGEEPWQTAVREWQEETGLNLPADPEQGFIDFRDGWKSSNGNYWGFVVYLLNESDLRLNDRDLFSDPDSEVGGVVAWVHPSDLPQHNLCPELLSDVDEVLAKVRKWLLTRRVQKALGQKPYYEVIVRFTNGRETRSLVYADGDYGLEQARQTERNWLDRDESLARAGRPKEVLSIRIMRAKYTGDSSRQKVRWQEVKSAAVRKSFGPVNRLKASFFETCDRDEEGHCIAGSGGDSGEDKPELEGKPQVGKPTSTGRELKGNKEITEWAEDHYSGWNDSLSDAEYKAFEKYSGAGYEAIVNALRKGGPGKFVKTVEALDAALERTSVPEDVTVFRGVRAGKLAEDIAVGSIIQDDAYVSTSLNRAVGEKFAHHTLMEIRVPKGSKGAAFDAIFEGGNRGENELMLPRNSRFRVTGVTNRSGKRVVTMELVHAE